VENLPLFRLSKAIKLGEWCQQLIIKMRPRCFLRRVPGADRDKSDILIDRLLKGGALSNDHIGKLFGISYSAASHEVPSLRIGMRANQKLLSTFSRPYSQFKL